MPRKDSQPQLKDQDMYEELREKGDSKEKAARISNAAANRGRTNVGKVGRQPTEWGEHFPRVVRGQ